MNTNTKSITTELQELAITADSIIALLEGLADMSHQIGSQKNDLDKKRLENVRNGLFGVIKLLDSELATKLYEFDFKYDSIIGVPTNPTIKNHITFVDDDETRANRLAKIGKTA